MIKGCARNLADSAAQSGKKQLLIVMIVHTAETLELRCTQEGNARKGNNGHRHDEPPIPAHDELSTCMPGLGFTRNLS